jgi:hypothetical protein
VLLLREVAGKINLMERLATCFSDRRSRVSIKHGLSRLPSHFSDETESSDVAEDFARERLGISNSFPNRGRQVAELLKARNHFK